MSQGKVTTRDDYAVGATLDVSLNQCPSPFKDDTLKAFITAYQAKKQPDDQGTFHLFTTLAQNEAQKAKALGVDGKLNFSYGPVSGDANIKFAMDNIQGSLDLSMIVRAHQQGRDVKCGLEDITGLLLRDSVTNAIKAGMTFDQFKQQYGEYLIIGFEYGGEVLFKSTYSTKSSDDKLSVAGGLSLSYGKMGFNISGSVKGDYKSSEIAKSTNITTQYSIFPSFDDELINGEDGIIPLLKKISNPLANDLDKNAADYALLAQKVQSKIQKLLSGKKLDKINCIVLPMKAIGCVNDAFVKDIVKAKDVQAFFKFVNPLYMKMSSMLKGLEVVNKNYDKIDPKGKPTTTINKWFEALNKNISLMDSIYGAKIYEYAELYDKRDKEEEKKDAAEIDKKFYQIDPQVLGNEFTADIMKPYHEKVKVPVTKWSAWIGNYCYDDINLLPKSGAKADTLIKGIRVYSKASGVNNLKYVRGISVKFEGDNNWYSAGTLDGDAQGLLCGDGEWFDTVKSRQGEIADTYNSRHGALVDRIEFSTNKTTEKVKRSVIGGGDHGIENAPLSEGKLCGLTVRLNGLSQNQIGISWVYAVKCKWITP